ncbi:MAG: hypothetical protein NZ993_09220, partial [Bacteroidetes bacterium]|nr:hypothetical protein [Bacteroidota bacterium]
PYGSPIRFARGLELLLRRAEVPLWVQTVGIYPLLWEHVRPELYAGFGRGWLWEPGSAGPSLADMEAELARLLSELEAGVRQGLVFRFLLEGRLSPQERRRRKSG